MEAPYRPNGALVRTASAVDLEGSKTAPHRGISQICLGLSVQKVDEAIPWKSFATIKLTHYPLVRNDFDEIDGLLFAAQLAKNALALHLLL
jgi:hypothetical protein